MSVIGMIAFTSCTSDLEQTKEETKKDNFYQKFTDTVTCEKEEYCAEDAIRNSIESKDLYSRSRCRVTSISPSSEGNYSGYVLCQPSGNYYLFTYWGYNGHISLMLMPREQ